VRAARHGDGYKEEGHILVTVQGVEEYLQTLSDRPSKTIMDARSALQWRLTRYKRQEGTAEVKLTNSQRISDWIRASKVRKAKQDKSTLVDRQAGIDRPMSEAKWKLLNVFLLYLCFYGAASIFDLEKGAKEGKVWTPGEGVVGEEANNKRKKGGKHVGRLLPYQLRADWLWLNSSMARGDDARQRTLPDCFC